MTAFPIEKGTLFLSGPLALDRIEVLAEALRAWVGSSSQEPVRVNMAGVTDVDTAAIQTLLAAKRMAAQAGRPFQLSAANETVRARFRLTGLDFLCEGDVSS